MTSKIYRLGINMDKWNRDKINIHDKNRTILHVAKAATVAIARAN